jgi:hypothetical protein
MNKTEIVNQQNREMGGQDPVLDERLARLELSLDEISYVSGAYWPIRPIKPWYCGEK